MKPTDGMSTRKRKEEKAKKMNMTGISNANRKEGDCFCFYGCLQCKPLEGCTLVQYDQFFGNKGKEDSTKDSASTNQI